MNIIQKSIIHKTTMNPTDKTEQTQMGISCINTKENKRETKFHNQTTPSLQQKDEAIFV